MVVFGCLGLGTWFCLGTYFVWLFVLQVVLCFVDCFIVCFVRVC